jgi:hypothetical protein
MTFPQGNHYTHEPDPLTDSAVHRLGLGTQVRLHLYGGETCDVGLLTIRDVSTWNDLADRVLRAMPLIVDSGRRRVLAGGAILWAEVITDPLEETQVGTFDTVAKTYDARSGR